MLPGLTSALTGGNTVFAKVASAFAPLATHAAYEAVPPTAEVRAGAMNAAAAGVLIVAGGAMTVFTVLMPADWTMARFAYLAIG